MKKFIRISSTLTITVTSGLDAINMSDKNSPVANKLKVQSAWVKTAVQLLNGVGYYPAEIKDWASVKALSDDGRITLGEMTDEVPEQYAAKANEVRAKFEAGIADYKRMQNTIKQYSSNGTVNADGSTPAF